MSGPTPVRTNDALLNPENCAIALIDYQPEQYRGVGSIDHDALQAAVLTLGQIAHDFHLPVVLSTVGVEMRGMAGTDAELMQALGGDVPEIDRSTLNSWEDPEFHKAVEATGRRKLVVAGLWTEICVAFPVLDALREGYEVYVVADAIGGVSEAAHAAAMQRMVQAGAVPISVIGLAAELQRDWGRDGADRLRRAMQTYFGRKR